MHCIRWKKVSITGISLIRITYNHFSSRAWYEFERATFSWCSLDYANAGGTFFIQNLIRRRQKIVHQVL